VADETTFDRAPRAKAGAAVTLHWGWARVDPRGAHDAGRRAARAALDQIDRTLEVTYDGSRPVIRGARLAISISHSRGVAVAVVGAHARLGVDLCEVARGPSIRTLAARFLAPSEVVLIGDDRSAAVLWAAKEAGLKSLGLGIYDAGILDDPLACPIRIASLVPPRYSSDELVLQIEDHDDVVLALACSDQTAPSTTTVAPFM
jgi:phosphopantetheinyl transferase